MRKLKRALLMTSLPVSPFQPVMEGLETHIFVFVVGCCYLFHLLVAALVVPIPHSANEPKLGTILLQRRFGPDPSLRRFIAACGPGARSLGRLYALPTQIFKE